MCPAERNEQAGVGDPSTVARIAALLTAFRPGDDALGISELARRTGLPKSSVHRLTGGLLAHGLLERDSAGVRLGLKLFEIGQLATRPLPCQESRASSNCGAARSV